MGSATVVNIDPYRRYRLAEAVVKYGDCSEDVIDDIWVNKLIDILRLRDSFVKKYTVSYMRLFEDAYPLYARLLQTFESDKPGGDRDVIEAVLLANSDCEYLANELGDARFDSLFLCLYRELFYNVIPILGNPVAEFQFVVAPLANANSNKLAVGRIWKILAVTGGIKLLVNKGWGSNPIKASDVQPLIQMAGYRNCSMILQYTAEGKGFFEDNPAGVAVLSTLSDFDSIRSTGRRKDYLAELDNTGGSEFSSLLSNEIKLISAPDATLKKLVELDGGFNPANEATIEKHEHKTFLNEGNDNE